MRSLLILSAFTFIGLSEDAKGQQNIPGEYYLKGVMEVASGFKLNADSSFEFFFSYGALDRYGEGKWTLRDNQIVFNSRPFPGNDFKLLASSWKDGNDVTVSIRDSNPELFSFVHCLVSQNGSDSLYDADQEGLIRLPAGTDTIRIVSEFSAERMSVFTVDSKKYNSFTFAFEPWITELFFKNFTLKFAGDHLEGKHPLLDDKIYSFEK